ncbi:DUF6924 domain-containing protein [Streptomyces sp. NPDC015350]|uniref:DUF6924 domain-containing protein n=1 Tax=Streptomyces sp. NPDC015350 TaxID=3364955 RepID=UPI0036FF9191
MIELDVDQQIPVILTSRQDPDAWHALVDALTKDDTTPIEVYEHRAYEGAGIDDLIAAMPDDPEKRPDCFFVADSMTLTHPEHPLLAVSLDEDDEGHTFRIIPKRIPAMASNLFIAHGDFAGYAADIDDDGILRRG